MQKVKIAGQQTEIFLRLKGSDCSSELIGLYDAVARLVSLSLQYGLRLRRPAITSLKPTLLAATSIGKSVLNVETQNGQ